MVVNLGSLVRHVVTLPKGLTEAAPEGFARLPIIVTQDRSDGRCGGFQVVVGNAQEDMVGHMGADVMVEVVKHSVVSVNGGEGALQEAPVLTPIPGNFRRGVV